MKKTQFKPVDAHVDFPKLEQEILKYWKENKIFEKSLEKDSPNGDWNFVDGPPFITGLPHYGSLLISIPKDIFPRYKTMNGYHVRRVWGWDCHGLPAENKVEEKLGIQRKKDIEEKIGVAKFIEECKLYVKNTSSEWEWYIDHIGRWVDFKDAYRTMDLPYMESVMWVFKQMYEGGHIYKGLRVSLYCPHCSTPISNFEVAMDADNYREVPDAATTYKYKIGEKTYILAWSTTPWNKIVTPALAVNPKLTYVKVEQKGEFYILAKTTIKMLEGKYKIVEEFKGEKLVGTKFEPHYDYYKNKIQQGEKAFEVIAGDFVTADEGTGVVTIAVYGEEDLKAMQQNNVHIEMHVDDEGTIKPDVPIFGGMYYLKANKAVNEDLAKRSLIYKDEEVAHSVAHCWRCHTRLYFAPQNAWYINIQNIKNKLKATGENVNWVPKHFKYGRYLKSLENAPDWCISRSRYWGSPVPVWECEQGHRTVPGSIKELEELSGQKIKDLHKPEIDEVTVKCQQCGKDAKRTPEVLDSWIEAGSAPYAERHFPFEKGLDINKFFPPDFITEYTGQIRAWFYVLHVIATALFNSHAFKNVLVTGVILGTDGRKMSKNFKNYPDPKELIQKYGGDALRLYLMGSPVINGEDIVISEEQYRNQVRGLLLIYWNIYNFFVTNAITENWQPQENAKLSNNVLDKWIVSRLQGTVKGMQKAYEIFAPSAAVAQMDAFVSDLSLWYIRRTRDRVGPTVENSQDKENAYQTMYKVLCTFTQVAAPLVPFITEEIYTSLTGNQSVHLTNFPKADEKVTDVELEKQMKNAQEIVSKIHAQRKEKNIKVRQPLSQLTYAGEKLNEQIEKLIADEVNVKVVKNAKVTKLDTKLTPALESEGQARDIIRAIQQARKEANCALTEKVVVQLPTWPKEFETQIKAQTLATKLQKGENLQIIRL